jgi:hypothetical protein
LIITQIRERKKTRREREQMGWQRRTLPPSYPGSTIRAGELNCRVRDGTGWTLTALATNTHRSRSLLVHSLFQQPQTFRKSLLWLQLPRQKTDFPALPTQSPRPLVPVSSTHCCASTPGLSSWSSPSGLTCSRNGESHLEVGFPLRCFQRLSPPEIATRPCRWHDNRRTSAPSTPVLSY